MSKWVAIKEKQRGKEVITIRRWVNKKLERLPVRKYRHFRDNLEEVQKYLLRLNESGKKQVQIKHAFISPTLQDEYLELLCTQSENKTTARCEFNYVKKYFLNFFIGREQILDPINWHGNQKTKWATFLLSDEAPPSISSKKQIIHAVNKFMNWLHEKRPTEIPKLIFEPFTKARLKELEATRVLKNKKRESYFIPETDFKLITKHIDPQILPFVLLSYHFGLRRAESMALRIADLRRGYLFVERQLLKINHYGPTKGRLPRKIPYWSISPVQVHEWIKSAPIMHPRTFSATWDDAIIDLKNKNLLKIEYNLHDLRHTWITRMIRQHEPRDVQMAAGHKNIQTTMGYIHDDRTLDDEQYIPEGA